MVNKINFLNSKASSNNMSGCEKLLPAGRQVAILEE
jgi:hypothetical protein